MKILYVCTGNICRSPLAEALTRAEAGGGIEEIGSAGIEGYHAGDLPDSRTIEVARQIGVSMAGQTARKVRAADFDTYDLILAMDRGHLKALRALQPEGSRARVELFMEYTTGQMTDVPDPYYGELDDFVRMREMLLTAIRSMIQERTRTA